MAEAAGQAPESESGSGTGSSGIGRGTTAGVLTFVGGGLGTVLVAITDFGSENGALAAARRNHTFVLSAAAAFAVVGMFLGAAYAIGKQLSPDDPDETVHVRKKRGADTLSYVLLAGALFILVGVFLGVVATSARTPGRPTIALTRADASTMQLKVTGSGFATDDQFELRARGYTKTIEETRGEDNPPFQLARARFSPDHNGDLEWSTYLNVDAAGNRGPIKAVTVVVDEGPTVRECDLRKAANDGTADGEDTTTPPLAAQGSDDLPTCLYAILSTFVPPAPAPSGPESP